MLLLALLPAAQAVPQDAAAAQPATAAAQASFLTVREFLAAGGAIGYVIMLLSFVMVALIADAAITLRRKQFIPPGLAEEIQRLLTERKLTEARSICLRTPGPLSQILLAGLEEVPGGHWPPVEKALEDA
ncbi:MAG: MotA/TolQ/ExbB proton channel family protein, partial [Planctomycetaceae bacterium]